MTEKLELMRGRGNVFRDFHRPNADMTQLKAIVAAKIIGILDNQGISVRKAESQAGVKASEFSRIRNAYLERVTVDRLMSILNGLHWRVDVKVSVKRYTPTLASHME